jgi:hypothetical protein
VVPLMFRNALLYAVENAVNSACVVKLALVTVARVVYGCCAGTGTSARRTVGGSRLPTTGTVVTEFPLPRQTERCGWPRVEDGGCGGGYCGRCGA